MREVQVSENVFLDTRMPIVVLRLFGMLPATYVNKNGRFILKVSKKLTIFYYVIALLIGAWTGFGICSDVYQFRREGFGLRIREEIDVYLNTFDIGMISLSVVLVILMAPFKIEYFMNALLSMDKIDTIIEHHVWETKWKRIIRIIGIMMAHVLVETILLFDGKYQQKDLEKYSLLKYMERYGNIYLSCPGILTQQLAYWSLIHSIRKRLRVMNNILERVTKNERRNLRRIFIDTEKTVRNRAYNGNLNIHSRKTPHGDIHYNTTDISDIIQLMMTVHENIYRCMLSINRFFDYPVLLILINCIMELIINPWILLSAIKFERAFSFLIPVTWAIIHVVQLFMLIEPMHQLLSEHNKTKLLITQLLKIVKDPRAIEKVEHFAIQYQLCSLKFSAVDMVILGRSLYTRVASAVTTYLVILLQIGK